MYWTRLCSMQPEIGPKHTFPFHLINFSFGTAIVRVSFIYKLFRPFFSRLSTSPTIFLLRIHSVWNVKYSLDIVVVFAKWSDAINYLKIFHATYKMNVSNGGTIQAGFFLSRLFAPTTKLIWLNAFLLHSALIPRACFPLFKIPIICMHTHTSSIQFQIVLLTIRSPCQA